MTAIRVIDDHITLANIGTKTHAEIEGHIQGIGNYAFPAADGTVNQILETDGAGVLSFVNKPASFACGSLNACNLTDIGTRPHSQLTNIGASDHHAKYTDVEAVAACDTANKFVERDEENAITSPIGYKRTTVGRFKDFLVCQAGQFIFGDLMLATIESTTHTFNQMYAGVVFPSVQLKGTDATKPIGAILFIKSFNTNESGVCIKATDAAGNLQTALSVYDTHLHFRWQTLDDLKNHPDAALSGTPKLIEFKINTISYYLKVYPTKA